MFRFLCGCCLHHDSKVTPPVGEVTISPPQGYFLSGADVSLQRFLLTLVWLFIYLFIYLKKKYWSLHTFSLCTVCLIKVSSVFLFQQCSFIKWYWVLLVASGVRAISTNSVLSAGLCACERADIKLLPCLCWTAVSGTLVLATCTPCCPLGGTRAMQISGGPTADKLY